MIILDEAQTLPRHLLAPCMRMIEELALNYGCTFVLCTATQPALDRAHFKQDKDEDPNKRLGLPIIGELAPDPTTLAKTLKRVTLSFVGERSNDDLIKEIESVTQGLAIVNSRKHALDLYNQAKAESIDGLFHLSTRQCAVHRKQLLKDIKARLGDADAMCRVVSTSLIEAGVDIDFTRVWRAEAGLDQIAQAAGRCNREGRRSRDESFVTVFSTPDYKPPAEIAGLIGDLSRIAKDWPDLLQPEAIKAYFEEVYWRVRAEGLDRHGIVAMFQMSSGKPNFAYRTAAEKFRMIESGMFPVVIPFDETAKDWIGKLGVADVPSGAIARALQSYVVQVPPRALIRLIDAGHVYRAHPQLRGDQFAVLRAENLYRSDVGLTWEDADYIAAEGLIW